MDKELLGNLELNQIHHMNCVDGMKCLPDNCIDLTVTSPPYDDLRNYKGYSFDFEDVADELYRITKDGGIVVWVIGDKTHKGSETGTSFKQALYFKEIGFNLHDTMIYEKQNPVPIKSNRYQPSFEFMFVLSKGRPKTFNPIMIEKKYMENRKSSNFTRNKDGDFTPSKPSKSKLRLKKNIWTYTVGKHHSSKDEIAFKHPAIFPEKLAEDHILSWSNEGDIVLDPFMGSGTTAKMALINNRKWLGFEIAAEYIEIANKRLGYIHN
ncbi:site-specific DNA-methyltransferase [Bacillus smithii]|uniref:DNA-methyltransferase n=1 Tax=Bacillus smithii TaxID=1479 RepID=UPI002E1E927C|nr:site-specific DNA-methyltransferase [Bacillus smithii]MED4929186.1 site-specific DNA-methyltransferase [Bacillus smithii]